MLPSKHDLSKILGLAYAAAGEPSVWTLLLAQVAARTGATSAALVIHDFEHALSSVSSSWELDPDLNLLYQDHYHALDVWAQRVSSVPTSHACISESLCPLPELRATEFYSDLLLKSRIEHAMFAVPENSRSLVASVSLYRDRSRSEFAQPDLHILEFLAPHLERAFKLHVRFSQLKSLSASADAALDMLPTGIIFVDSLGKIVHLNRSAAAVIAEKDGLLASRAGLQAERPSESSFLTKAIQQAVSTRTAKGFRLEAQSWFPVARVRPFNFRSVRFAIRCSKHGNGLRLLSSSITLCDASAQPTDCCARYTE